MEFHSNGGGGAASDADDTSPRRFDSMTEAQFAALGRDDAAARKALLAAREAADPGSVQRFQLAVVPLRLQRTRLKSEVEDMQAAIERAQKEAREAAELEGAVQCRDCGMRDATACDVALVFGCTLKRLTLLRR